MGLSIGDINFGLEAQTEGLQRAVSQLHQFQKLVNETARSQEAGAASAATAMGRQESAIRRAVVQVANMRSEFQRLGAAPAQLAPATIALQRLTREMTSGRLSSVEYSRSMDAFNTRMGRMGRTLKELRANDASKHLNRMTEVIRDLESASVLAIGPLSGLGARIRAMAAITSRSTITMAIMLGTITALGVGIAKLGSGAVRAQMQFEEYSSRIATVTHHSFLAGKEIQRLAGLTSSLGLDLQTSARAFSTLAASARGTKLEGEGARQVFEGIATAAAALRLNNEQLQGAMRAVEQMMSKGIVQAEELRGQLAERLPGAFTLSAEAMGVTTQKLNAMLKSGEVLAADLLPKLAKHLKDTFGAQALKNVDSARGALNGLSTATFQFNLALDKASKTSGLFITVIQGTTNALKFLTDNMGNLFMIIGLVAGAMLGFSGPAILTGIIRLGKGIFTIAKAMTAVNIAMLANPAGSLLMVVSRLALAIAGAVFGFKLMENSLSGLGDETADLLKEMDALLEVSKSYGSILKDQQTDILKRGQDRLNQLQEEQAALVRQIALLKEKTRIQITPTQGAFGINNDQQIASLIALGGSDEQLQRVNNEIAQLMQQLDKLSKVKTRDPMKDIQDAITGDGKRERDLERMIARIREMAAQLKDLQAITSNMPNTVQELDTAMGIKKARDELRQFTENELQRLLQVFQELGFTEDSSVTALASLTAAINDQEDAIKDHRQALEETPGILAEYADEVNRLTAELKALETGSLALEQFEMDVEYTEAIKEMREELEKTNLTLDQRNKLLDQYGALLGKVQQAEADFSDASDRMASVLVEGFEDILFSQDSLKESFRSLEQAIIKLITQILILEPIERAMRARFEGAGANNSTEGFMASLLSAWFGGGGGGEGMAVGGIIGSNGRGIDSEMVAFSKSPTESVYVRRNSESAPGGGMTIVNNFHVSTPTGDVPRKTQQQLASEMITAANRARRRNG